MITKEQFVKEMKENLDMYNELVHKCKQLQREYLDTYPLKPKMKVVVLDYKTEKECYVSTIHFSNWLNTTPDVSFTKPKKDGSYGESGAGIYDFDLKNLIKIFKDGE